MLSRKEILFFLSSISRAINRIDNQDSLDVLRMIRNEFIALLYDGGTK
jgi:hypothetical protein